MPGTNRRRLFGALAIFLCAAAVEAQSHKVTLVRAVDYVANADYPDGKDRLDLYIPEGVKNAPVIFSIHGGLLSMGDRTEDSFVGQRFAPCRLRHRRHQLPSVAGRLASRARAGCRRCIRLGEAQYPAAWRRPRSHSRDRSLRGRLPRDAACHRFPLPRRARPDASRHRGPRAGQRLLLGREDGRCARPAEYVWGTEPNAWIDASPAHHLRTGVPPVLLVDTDGDEDWRQQQNIDMAAALRSAGNKDVTLRQVKGRTHMSVWTEMLDGESEETSSLILAFARRVLSER